MAGLKAPALPTSEIPFSIILLTLSGAAAGRTNPGKGF